MGSGIRVLYFSLGETPSLLSHPTTTQIYPLSWATRWRGGNTRATSRVCGRHPGVVDIRGRRDFSRFDPSPEEGPHFSNFGPPAERRPFCKKVFGLGEKAWFSRFGRPRGAVGHFSRGLGCPSVPGTRVTSRFDPKVPHFSRKGPQALAQDTRGQTSEAQRAWCEPNGASPKPNARRCVTIGDRARSSLWSAPRRVAPRARQSVGVRLYDISVNLTHTLPLHRRGEKA